jgi:hypothetical protein
MPRRSSMGPTAIAAVCASRNTGNMARRTIFVESGRSDSSAFDNGGPSRDRARRVQKPASSLTRFASKPTRRMRPANENTAVVEIWAEPAPMEPGAPDPLVVREGNRVWLAYRARDADFPGWGHPAAAEYLAAHPGELFGVIQFDGVAECTLGPPGDERLREHPLFGRGLQLYEFHRLRSPGQGANRWIVTFHDDTLDIWADAARSFPTRFASTGDEAIMLAKTRG